MYLYEVKMEPPDNYLACLCASSVNLHYFIKLS